jgi:hypothetical protein
MRELNGAISVADAQQRVLSPGSLASPLGHRRGAMISRRFGLSARERSGADVCIRSGKYAQMLANGSPANQLTRMELCI